MDLGFAACSGLALEWLASGQSGLEIGVHPKCRLSIDTSVAELTLAARGASIDG